MGGWEVIMVGRGGKGGGGSVAFFMVHSYTPKIP